MSAKQNKAIVLANQLDSIANIDNSKRKKRKRSLIGNQIRRRIRGQQMRRVV